jgi:hypothetical protein
MNPLIPCLVAAMLTLSGCGESSKSGSTGSAARITGVVLNDETPASRARIEAIDNTGKVIANTEVNGEPHYRITLPANTAYPVVLKATIEGEADPLKAAVTSDLVTDQDISTVTTLVVDTAMNLGGLTEINLAKAAGAAISQRKSTSGSGGSAGFKGDPTKQYGGWH